MKRKTTKLTSLLLAVMMVVGLFTAMPITASAEENATYNNLYAAVQGETNAAAHYRAFALKAEVDGYPVIALLFNATADAEAKHADDEWAILQSMGATVRPVAEAVTVGTTAENLQAAFDGETYEYTVMYPDFVAAAQAEGMSDARRIFNFAMRAEEVHAGNFADVLANLSDAAYINSKYGVVYRCVTCGEVVTSRPNRCPICGANGDTFVMYEEVDPCDNGHDYVGVVTDPTCTDGGYTTYTCSRCGDWYIGDYTEADPCGDCEYCNPDVTITGVSGAKFISIVETAKNSRVWLLTFEVTVEYSNGTSAVERYSVELNGNNANLSGKYTFDNDHDLAGYTLTYDIKGNGSNIKAFSINNN